MKNAHKIMYAVLLASALNAFAADKDEAKASPTFADVRYGEHERNVLDLWLPGGNKPSSPAPLVVYIHGGGFGGGNKNAGGNQQQLVAVCKEQGWIYAAINYRYAKKNGVTVLDSMSDGKRAVQFLRHNAEQWGGDPKRVALYGGSAGAGMCLWIGLQDDMADPGNADPVLRESTRVSCIGMINGQITYDRQEMISIIFKDVKLSPQFMVAKNGSNDSPGVSMLKYISADDPPVFAFSFWPDTPPQEGVHFGHHPRHGLEVKRRYDALGLRCEVLLVKNENVEKNDKAKSAGHARMMDFFASVMTQKKPRDKIDIIANANLVTNVFAADVGQTWIPANTPKVTGIIAAIWTEIDNKNTIPSSMTRAFAARAGLGTCDQPAKKPNADYLDILASIAQQTGHPEIAYVGIIPSGGSASGVPPVVFAHDYPQRCIAFVPIVVGAKGDRWDTDTVITESMAKVPGLFVCADRDAYSGSVKQYDYLLGARVKNGPWTYALIPGAVHGAIGDAADEFIMQWIVSTAKLRTPATISTTSINVYKDIDMTQGYLGGMDLVKERKVDVIGTPDYGKYHNYTCKKAWIAPYSSFATDKSKAVWLPDQKTAELWLAVMTGKADETLPVVKRTAPTNSVNHAEDGKIRATASPPAVQQKSKQRL